MNAFGAGTLGGWAIQVRVKPVAALLCGSPTGAFGDDRPGFTEGVDGACYG